MCVSASVSSLVCVMQNKYIKWNEIWLVHSSITPTSHISHPKCVKSEFRPKDNRYIEKERATASGQSLSKSKDVAFELNIFRC